MKQTAVELLVEKLNSKYSNDDFIITHINEINQAKEMEKQQIIDAFNTGLDYNADVLTSSYLNKSDNGEQYYNETFKQ